ncbi:hypothetical protein FN846DRAFT_906168 [Sphaerosporella brunnea]|uniref:Uncharacterized protein n=1 Tax=Sphaerosporella brunnea TaxID=1250544 RepID=A0A5J5EZR8_9PEZI|nr:hypothetical protein FN846DRAFT_906168 [Sphaerosporella brunnea]
MPKSVPNVAATRSVEFLDGYNMLFGLDRFRIMEGIFTPRSMLASANITHPYPKHTLGLKVFTAMKDVDVDIKQIILNQLSSQALEVCSTSSMNIPVKRRYTTWLDGGILASLRNFHQLWISKKEHGANIVEKRCK